MQGRGILITGGSQGIGKAVAIACVEAGADVCICARNQGDLQDSRILFYSADVSQPQAVEDAVAFADRELPNFNGLVNAAGINGPKGLLDGTDPQDWMATVQVNLFGTMLMCRAALTRFRRRGYGKIVNFSGGGATSPRPRFSAYAASKAAVVSLTETLAHELEGSGIYVNAIAPGAVNTRMLEEVISAGPDKVGGAAYDGALKQKQSGGTPPEAAAGLCVSLLSAETDGFTGRLISAVWDPWQSLASRKNELMSTDVYTLRRIIPKDRGLNWD